jgi:hypothetical protein
MIPKNSKIIFVLGDHRLESGVLFLRLCQLLPQLIFSIIIGRDLPKVEVKDGRPEKGLQKKSPH